MWSVHKDVSRQAQQLQEALDVLQNYGQNAGSDISAHKSSYIGVAIRQDAETSRSALLYLHFAQL